MRMAVMLFLVSIFLKPCRAMFPERNRAADTTKNELGHFHTRFQLSNPFRKVREFSDRDRNSRGCASGPGAFRCLTRLLSSFPFQSTGCRPECDDRMPKSDPEYGDRNFELFPRAMWRFDLCLLYSVCSCQKGRLVVLS